MTPMDDELIFRIAFWTLLGAILIIRGISVLKVHHAEERILPDKTAIKREGEFVFAFRLVTFFLLIAFIILYSINTPFMNVLSFHIPSWLRWLGVCTGGLSLMLWAWSQATLDKYWSPQLQLRREHTLIMTGPYKRIRHPLYTSMVGWALGLALLTANWGFVFLAVVTIGVLMRRVPMEEEMMVEQFGEEYNQYMQTTGRYLPKIQKSH